jgi:hypothetical protein
MSCYTTFLLGSFPETLLEGFGVCSVFLGSLLRKINSEWLETQKQIEQSAVGVRELSRRSRDLEFERLMVCSCHFLVHIELVILN